LAKFLKTGYKYSIDLKGLGLSLVDNEPKEIMYLSVYKINFKISKVCYIYFFYIKVIISGQKNNI
jgi:hypothetical protein